MNPATVDKLQRLAERFDAINLQLADPKIIAERAAYQKLSIELAGITPLVDAFAAYRDLHRQLTDARAMLDDEDAAIRQMAKAEIPALEEAVRASEAAIHAQLVPVDRDDARNIFLEIRAGTGGDEAALFAGDLFRMYHAYAEARGWTVETISRHEGEHGGYKEIISRVAGAAWSRLKFESGAHRVQRVPETESQGRIHTSACTVAVLVEADELDEIDISPADLRVDTYRASGAGGQHVNKTDSAVRLTHLPSGVVVECQDERSQHKNRARALAILKSRLRDDALQKQRREEADTRKSLVGSGDRSQRIRTYNYPQGRVTDHRIGLTLHKLDRVIAGDLAQLLDAVNAWQLREQGAP